MIKQSLLAVCTVGLLFSSPLAYAEENISNAKLSERVNDLEEMVEYLDGELEKTNEKSSSGKSGANRTLLSGYMFANYFDVANSDTDALTFGFNPIILYKVGEKLLVETEFEANSSEVGLEYAQATYLLNDSLSFGAGKFLLPIGTFGERLHPTWINKLPDAPKAWAHGSGFVPMTDIGAQLRGGTKIGAGAKINYAAYITNGPELDTTTGTLSFGGGSENNSNKAVGGRIGILPRPNMELGLSFMSAQAGSASFSEIDASIMAADFSYSKGGLGLRGEWVRLDVDKTRAILNGEKNQRTGMYLQASYRGKGNFEGVVRYDEIDLPESLSADDSRTTFGVNYWVNGSTAFKAAYRIDSSKDSAKEADAFLTQFTIGF